jgi:hypothetical protein
VPPFVLSEKTFPLKFSGQKLINNSAQNLAAKCLVFGSALTGLDWVSNYLSRLALLNYYGYAYLF